MHTYTTLDGRVLDLRDLTEEEREFFEWMYAAYRDGMTWGPFSRLVEGVENPLVRATGGWITPAVWDHPLFQAVRDLESRVGILRGGVRAEPGDDAAWDPLDREDATAEQTRATAG